jgi:hypothetical protein
MNKSIPYSQNRTLARIVIAWRKRLNEIAIIVFAGIIQLLYMFSVPFSGGYDSAGYLAIGRMYANLPYQMWSIKYYYPPGQSFLFWLTGITNFGNLNYYAILIWFCGTTFPLFIYKILEIVNKKLGFVAALLFAMTFQGSLFSKDLMPHYLGGYFIVFFMWTILRLKKKTGNFEKSFGGYFLGILLFLSYLIRPSNLYIGIFIIMYVYFIVIKNPLKYRPGNMRLVGRILIPFVILSAGVILLRPPEPNQELSNTSVIQNQGALTMFIGMYTGSPIINGTAAIIPACGVATQKMYSITKRYLENSSYPSAVVFSQYPDVSKKVAIDNVLKDWWEVQEYQPYAYYINWALESELSYQEKDRLMMKSILENIKCKPLEFGKYFSWNSSRALKGEIWNYGEKDLKGYFYQDASWISRYGPPQEGFFKDVSSPNFETNLIKDYTRTTSFNWFAKLIEKILNKGLDLLPWINLVAFIGLFITRGDHRRLQILLFAAGVGNLLLVSLCWPVQLRYYYPSLPFFIMSASVTIYTTFAYLKKVTQREKL